MAVVAGFQALEQIAGREAELARWLHAQFRRRLTADDTRDAVADAIATAHMSRAELEELDVGRLEAWVRTRAYRNAIDQIRTVDGYGQERRRASVNVDDYAETLGDSSAADVLSALDDELSERLMDGGAARSVELALERLTPDERRLLRLRHYDGLDVKTIAALLDIHPKKYERLHTRAISKLRTIFIETTAGEHCEPVRALIARSRHQALVPALSAEVAAHVESCAQCHAYEKRSMRLIATLPLPAPALADRFWSRLNEYLPSFGQHSEAIAGTGAAAAGGGGAASSGLLAGIGAKTVALCGGAAATATCVGALTLPITKPDPRPEGPDRAAKGSGRPAVAPSRGPASVTPASDPSGSRLASAAKPQRAEPPRSPKSKVTGSIGVESFGTPTGGRATAGANAPPPPPPPATRFSQEFSP